MSRIILVILAMSTLVGCRSGGFDPLGVRGPSRVPPPPTGTIGDGGYGDYYAPVPEPSVSRNSAATWGESEYRAPPVLSEASPLPSRPAPAVVADNRVAQAADNRPTLRPADNSLWLNQNDQIGSGTVNRAYPPNLLPATNATPLASQLPRIRGFPNSGRQEIFVPDEYRGNLASQYPANQYSGNLPSQYQNGQYGNGLSSQYRSDVYPNVRQASAEGRWLPRYDDIRR